MPKVVHFELNVKDVNKTKEFYENVFAWKIEKWEGPMDYWVIEAGKEDEPGINGGLQNREEPGAQVFNYIQVPSVEDFKKKIEKAGGTIESPKITVPGVGHFYMFKDTEGNKLGIEEEDEDAK